MAVVAVVNFDPCLLVGLNQWGVHMTRGCVRWIVILLGWGISSEAAWRMAIGRPKEYRSKVDAAMQ